MRNELIIGYNLESILESTDIILERFSKINTPDDFMVSPFGITQFDSIVMRLQSIGELIKTIDKHKPDLLIKYQNIDWNKIIRMRDLISHHYITLDPGVIFNVCKNDIPKLKTTIE